ncbi:hypothetical protein [Pectinatus frisingensis]|uniref:hypothetical protein n=1 Tax=Pectinatus frisingensis TaxID=865 RepID=UPI0018C62D23|nr:hypothetical protein [Pectinatus frisingensis]
MYKIPVFLSYPVPHMQKQKAFIDSLINQLNNSNLLSLTLGTSEYTMDAPLIGIRSLMLSSNGFICVAFRRTYIEKGVSNYGSDIADRRERSIEGKWITSPYSQIEPAMALMLGIPILILRESGVIEDGILEKGASGIYLPEFNLEDGSNYFGSDEWNALFKQWEHRVISVKDNKGELPKYW